MQAAHLRVEDRVRIAQEPAVGVTVFVGPDGLPIDLDFEGAILQANGATDAASRQEVESRDSAIERILKIAGEIGVKYNFPVPMIEGIPCPFNDKPCGWSWDFVFEFSSRRYETLKRACNRHFVTENETNSINMFLTLLVFYSKHRGACHFSGIRFSSDARSNARVSFGKRVHGRQMRSGWTVTRPTSLVDFDETRANIIPENWYTNVLRGNRPTQVLAGAIRTLTESMYGRGVGSESMSFCLDDQHEYSDAAPPADPEVDVDTASTTDIVNDRLRELRPRMDLISRLVDVEWNCVDNTCVDPQQTASLDINLRQVFAFPLTHHKYSRALQSVFKSMPLPASQLRADCQYANILERPITDRNIKLSPEISEDSDA